MTVGIYKIHHKTSNSIYIGQSTNIEKRWKRHIQELKKGTHHNLALQYLWVISREEEFEFAVLEAFEKFDSHIIQQNTLSTREHYFIEFYFQNKGAKCINLNFGGYVETIDSINESLLDDPNSKWGIKKRLNDILAECRAIDAFLVIPRPEMEREKKYIERKKAHLQELQREYSGIKILKNIIKPSKIKIHNEIFQYFQSEYDKKYRPVDEKIKDLFNKKQELLLEIKSLRSKLNDL